MVSQAPGDLHPALRFSLSTTRNSRLWTKLADDAAAEANRDSMRTRARLELGEQVPHVRFHSFLREEQALTDLAIDETVRDQLQNLDLACRRLLLELAKRALERDHVRTAGAATPCRHLFEATGVRQITAEDLLALSSVHAPNIGGPARPL